MFPVFFWVCISLIKKKHLYFLNWMKSSHHWENQGRGIYLEINTPHLWCDPRTGTLSKEILWTNCWGHILHMAMRTPQREDWHSWSIPIRSLSLTFSQRPASLLSIEVPRPASGAALGLLAASSQQGGVCGGWNYCTWWHSGTSA